MNSYVIVTDSAGDLSAQMVKDMDVTVLPLSFNIRGTTLQNRPDHRDMSIKEFYRLVREGEMPTTSAVNVQQYVEALTPALAEGKDALILAFSSALSATCQSAQMAAEELKEKFPERKIYVVDTLSGSLGQGMQVWMASEKRKAGEDIDAVRAWCEENKGKVCTWVSVDDLMHLKRGGRLSAATAVVGTMLQVKPLIHLTDEGTLVAAKKARGRKGALEELVKQMEATAVAPEGQVVFISHGDCLEDAQYVGERVKERCHVKDVVYGDIGPVIGSHTGPGTVVISFLGQPR